MSEEILFPKKFKNKLNLKYLSSRQSLKMCRLSKTVLMKVSEMANLDIEKTILFFWYWGKF